MLRGSIRRSEPFCDANDADDMVAREADGVLRGDVLEGRCAEGFKADDTVGIGREFGGRDCGEASEEFSCHGGYCLGGGFGNCRLVAKSLMFESLAEIEVVGLKESERVKQVQGHWRSPYLKSARKPNIVFCVAHHY